MRKLEWSEQARTELRGITRHIANENPYAAERVLRRIREAANALLSFQSGRIGRVAGTYEKRVRKTRYILAFDIRHAGGGLEIINILHVIHTSRDWPAGEWPKE